MTPEAWIQTRTGARSAQLDGTVQSLWQGYGRIERWRLEGCVHPTVILKVVRPPSGQGIGHERKLRSYTVEAAFYERHAPLLSGHARVAALLGHRLHRNERWLLLEDLDPAGFPHRSRGLDAAGLGTCLDWLAGFHARFLGEPADGLWERGTYWHLGTRPEEWDRMPAGPLKEAAAGLDAALAAARTLTLVHGDAKPANFCFGLRPGDPVAGVDFQYVGRGIGLVDVAYLVGCMGGRWCMRHAGEALQHYFQRLRQHAPAAALHAEADWRPLWPVAWADFARFMAGWGHQDWRRDPYTALMVREAIASL